MCEEKGIHFVNCCLLYEEEPVWICKEKVCALNSLHVMGQ